MSRARTRGLAYAATLWAFGFGALSFYWALGGTWLMNTQSAQILELSREGWFLAVVGLTGLMKVAAGLVALSLVQGWGRAFPLGLRRVSAGAIGAVLLLYGGANLAVRGLMALGILPTPASMHTPQATWHLVLWDPFFVLGGVLFLLCSLYVGRSRDGRVGTATGRSNDKVAL